MRLIKKIKAYFKRRKETNIMDVMMEMIHDYAIHNRCLYLKSIRNTVTNLEYFIDTDVSDTCYRIYIKNDKGIGYSFPVAEIRYEKIDNDFIYIKRIIIFSHKLFNYSYKQWGPRN